jgi:hypothetical protein
MRSYLLPALLALLVVPAACGGGQKAAEAQPTLPPMLIDDRGTTMPLDKAIGLIAYKPWIPPGQVLKYAIIPPLGGEDTPQNDGFAVEYMSGSHAMLLSEWPKQNFTLTFMKAQDITFTPCTIVHYKSDGVAWTTGGKLAMTLQPDGTLAPRDIEAEAKRLIAAGACR